MVAPVVLPFARLAATGLMATGLAASLQKYWKDADSQTIKMLSEAVDDIFEDDEKEIEDFAKGKGKYKDRTGDFVIEDSITSQKNISENSDGNDDLVYMHVDDYMRLTGSEFTGRHIDIADKIYSIANKYIAGNKKEKLFKVPSLFLNTKDGIDATVYGVEGRHVAMGLQKAGYDMIPVSLKYRQNAEYHFGRAGNALNKKPKYIWSAELEYAENPNPLTTKDYIYYSEEMKNTDTRSTTLIERLKQEGKYQFPLGG